MVDEIRTPRESNSLLQTYERGTHTPELAVLLTEMTEGRLKDQTFRSRIESTIPIGLGPTAVVPVGDQVWVADWNKTATTSSSYIRSDGWLPYRRAHQSRRCRVA